MLHRFRFIFFLAILVHLFWGTLLLASPSPGYSTPIHQTYILFGQYGTAATFLIAAGLASYAILTRVPDYVSIWFLLPQTAILCAASSGGIYASVVGHYADGVPRPWQFILADQLPMVLLATVHFATVILLAREADLLVE